MYVETVSHTEGLPFILPVTSLSCHGNIPRPWTRPNMYVIAARIFCAIEYVSLLTSGPFLVPFRYSVSQLNVHDPCEMMDTSIYVFLTYS